MSYKDNSFGKTIIETKMSDQNKTERNQLVKTVLHEISLKRKKVQKLGLIHAQN